VKAAGKKVKNVAGRAWDNAKEKAAEIKDEMDTDDLRYKSEEAADKAKDAMQAAGRKVKSALWDDSTQKNAGRIKVGPLENGNMNTGPTESEASVAADRAKDAAKTVTEKVSDVAGSVWDTVKQTAANIKEKVMHPSSSSTSSFSEKAADQIRNIKDSIQSAGSTSTRDLYMDKDPVPSDQQHHFGQRTQSWGQGQGDFGATSSSTQRRDGSIYQKDPVSATDLSDKRSSHADVNNSKVGMGFDDLLGSEGDKSSKSKEEGMWGQQQQQTEKKQKDGQYPGSEFGNSGKYFGPL
jgi:hypothetical protein